MVKNTILLGALLTILGTGTYALVGFDPSKATALLPAAFGIVFLLLGGMALWQSAWRRYLLPAAVALALLAFLGTAPGLLKAMLLIAGRQVERPAAAVEQGINALLCLGFVGRSVKSYLDARGQPFVGEDA